MTRHLLRLSLLFLLALCAGTASADIAIDPPFAAVRGLHDLWVYEGDTQFRIDQPGTGLITGMVWHENTLAYSRWDAGFYVNIYVLDERYEPVPVAQDIQSVYAFSFTADGRILFARSHPDNFTGDNPYRIDFFAVEPVAGAEPAYIGTIGDELFLGDGCGGGSPFPTDWRLQAETSFSLKNTILAETPYGILHSLECGSSTGLLNVETGQNVEIGDNFGDVALSPDGTRAAGLVTVYDPDELSYLLAVADLESQTVQTFETAAQPEQVIWSADGESLFYAVRQPDGELSLTQTQRDAVRGVSLGYAFTRYAVSIRRYDLATGEDTLVYTAPDNTYAIGRMFAMPDGDALMFSRVPDLTNWIDAWVDGRIDDRSTIAEQLGTVPVDVLRLNLTDGSVMMFGAGDLAQFTPNLGR